MTFTHAIVYKIQIPIFSFGEAYDFRFMIVHQGISTKLSVNLPRLQIHAKIQRLRHHSKDVVAKHSETLIGTCVVDAFLAFLIILCTILSRSCLVVASTML